MFNVALKIFFFQLKDFYVSNFFRCSFLIDDTVSSYFEYSRFIILFILIVLIFIKYHMQQLYMVSMQNSFIGNQMLRKY